MNSRRHKIIILVVILAAVFGLWWLIRDVNLALLNPKGAVAEYQRNLIFTAVIIMLIAVIPVFFSIFYIARKYRAGNSNAVYAPNADSSNTAQVLWLGFLCLIIGGVSVLTWRSAHDLDPSKPIHNGIKPVVIQVVALGGKWLFIYPEYNIASVNFIQFPVHSPLSFELTADASTNSFWIPQLGGQMYAMQGMSTKLHLLAGEAGEFAGSSTEISGPNFADMKFIAKAATGEEFSTWIKKVQKSSETLDKMTYEKLVKSDAKTQTVYYSSVANNLYSNIIMKYMDPSHAQAEHGSTMEGMIH